MVITMLGASAHSAAGDHAHLSSVAVMSFVVAAAVVLRFVQGRPGSPTRLVAALAAGQLLFHVLVRPVHTSEHAHSMTTVVSSHDHSTGLRRSVAPLAPVLAQWIGDGLLSLLAQPGMLLAHVIAAGAAGWWLARGEMLAVAALSVIATVFLSPPESHAAHLPHPSAWVPAAQPRALSPLSRYRARILARRGPPLPVWDSLLPV